MYRASGFALAAEFRLMSCQNYTDTHTNGKMEEGNECFGAKLRKHTVRKALIKLLTSIVSREDVFSALKKLGFSVEIL